VSGARWGGDADELFPAKLPPGPHRLPRELVRENQRRRILQAALDVFAERGYPAATVKDLIRGAGVSRATFYEAFADKEACMAALHDEVLTWLSEQVAAAVAEPADWAAKVRVGVAKTIELLAEDPRLAAVCAVEALAIRVARIRARHERMVEELCRGLRAGRNGEELPEILEPALIGGAIYLVGRSIVYREGPDAAALASELAELMLAPYSG